MPESRKKVTTHKSVKKKRHSKKSKANRQKNSIKELIEFYDMNEIEWYPFDPYAD